MPEQDTTASELTALDAEALSAREAELREQLAVVNDKPRTVDTVAELEALATQIAAIRAETTRRAEEQATLDAKAADILATVAEPESEPENGEADAPAPEQAPETPGETVEQPAAIPPETPQAVPEQQPAEQPQAVAASTKPTLNQVGKLQPRSLKPAPKVAMTLTAAGDIPGYHAGQRLDMNALVDAVMAKTRTIARMPGEYLVASLNWQFPDERTLGLDPHDNQRKLDKVTSPKAITAAGGLCAPLEARYDFFDLGATDARPVFNGAFTRFGASRGGVRFVRPPLITGYSSGLSQWTAANDANPSNPATKPVVAISCGTEVTANVYAVPLRVRFGNFMNIFDREQVEIHIRTAMAAHARYAEGLLLTAYDTDDLDVPAASGVLGATRELLYMLDNLATNIRDVRRLPDGAPMRAILPRYAASMMRDDIARQLATDLGGTVNPFNIGAPEIESWFRARGINITWSLGDLSGDRQTAQTAAALVTYPATTKIRMFPEGLIGGLDGGRLDLGVVRDSTLNSTNDWELFVETFEGYVRWGAQDNYSITATVCASGGSAATVTAACPI